MRYFSVVFALFIPVASLMTQSKSSIPAPPAAKVIPIVHTAHGESRVDNYFWLREKKNPEVEAYLNAENEYTNEMSKPLKELENNIYNEILKRWKQTDLSVPYKKGEYYYYSRTIEGQQYPQYCRKHRALDAPEQIVLDLNILAAGKAFLSLGSFEISDDGTKLAYTLDTTGFRVYNAYVKDLISGLDIPVPIGQATVLKWASDGKSILFVKEDDAKRPYRLLIYTFGSEEPRLLYEEKDPLYIHYISRTLDGKYLVATSVSTTTTEVRYCPADNPLKGWKLLYPREEGHEYYVDHRDGTFYIRTNKNAKNFRIVTVKVTDPAMSRWVDFVPHVPSVKVADISLFRDFAVVTEREQALIRFRVHYFKKGTVETIRFAEEVYAASEEINADYNTTAFRYAYESFITPRSIFDYDVDETKSVLLKQTEVLGGYNPGEYETRRLWADARDGKKVPLSVAYKKGTPLDGSAPLYMYGYGAYGISRSAGFAISRISILDRGVIYVLAHVRGGGELGEEWYEDGRLKNKMNTFNDFIDAAEYLIKNKYTSKGKIAIEGGSAGGLLIGAVLNMKPELFGAAHLAVPFVDVINTMNDESLPLTVGEFLEWGNPKVKEDYDYIKQYCPYTNIAQRPYPPILVTTSFNDSQVMYWEPAKYVAKMRATRKDSAPLLLKTNMGAGHGGASGRYDAQREVAFRIAFLLNQLGIAQ